MDAKQRLLLRRYVSTGDPHDAAAFANTAMRAGVDVDNIEVEVWIGQILNQLPPRWRDDISLHPTRQDAYHWAANLASNITSSYIEGNYEDDPDWNMQGWIDDFFQFIGNKQWESALDVYNGQMFDITILVYSRILTL